jgi:hypothetical protein
MAAVGASSIARCGPEEIAAIKRPGPWARPAAGNCANTLPGACRHSSPAVFLLCLEVITPTMPIADLNRRLIDQEGRPLTSLGRLMSDLEVSTLQELSHFLTENDDGLPKSQTIVQVYRELVEWAVLYDLIKKDFGSDTLIVFDGDLRSKAFSRDLFARFGDLLQAEIDRHARQRRSVFLVGVMKSSSVLSRYRLAFALEGVLRGQYPAYLEVPEDLENEVYRYDDAFRLCGRF